MKIRTAKKIMKRMNLFTGWVTNYQPYSIAQQKKAFKALRIPYDIRPIITLYKKQKPRKPQLLAYTGLI